MLKNGEKIVALLLACAVSVTPVIGGLQGGSTAQGVLEEACLSWYAPYLRYAQEGWENIDAGMLVDIFPLYRYLAQRETATTYEQYEYRPELEMESLLLAVEAENETALLEMEAVPETSEVSQEQTEEPAQTVAQTETEQEPVTDTAAFVPATTKSVSYLKEQLSDPSFLKEQFYTEDATTYISPEQLEIDTLLGFDATLKQDASQPQILIYHTHSQEGYADSDLSDASTTIMGVGEYLSAILRTQYGYNVLHHLGQYDVESRDYAYSNAAEGLEQVLAEYPSIEVIIDLHRDEMPDDVRLVTTLQGRTTAKFMFFNGLSYTKERGEITSLPNPYIQDNLSFAFQMKLTAEEYYPGLARKSYLKGYRYNLHYRAKSLLIELGAQNNTVEEAMNACPPLAHIIDLVLQGNCN